MTSSLRNKKWTLFVLSLFASLASALVAIVSTRTSAWVWLELLVCLWLLLLNNALLYSAYHHWPRPCLFVSALMVFSSLGSVLMAVFYSSYFWINCLMTCLTSLFGFIYFFDLKDFQNGFSATLESKTINKTSEIGKIKRELE